MNADLYSGALDPHCRNLIFVLWLTYVVSIVLYCFVGLLYVARVLVFFFFFFIDIYFF